MKKNPACWMSPFAACLALISLSSGCATRENPSDPGLEKETLPEAARKAGRFVVMRAASTPVKVAAGVGTAARAISEKVHQEETDTEETPINP